MNFKNKLPYLPAAMLMIFFLFVVSRGLSAAQSGDENVYYYMAKLVSEGKIPYKNFFYAHPPIHVYILALVYKVFGFNIIVLKMVPLASSLITSFFVFKIAKQKFGNYEAVAALILFLFSYTIMFNSVFSFGIMTATMFLTIGFYFLTVKNNHLIAGIFFAIAGMTRLLALIPAVIALLFVLFSDRRNFVKLSSSFLLLFLLANFFFIMIAGSSYADSVYKYHFMKTFSAENNFKEYSDIIKLNWALFLSAILLIFIKEKRNIGIFAACAFSYLFFLIFLKKIFGFYFIAVFPLLAIIGGYAVVSIFRELNIHKKTKAGIAVLLALIFMWNLASDTLFLQRIGFTGFDRGKDLSDFINSDKTTILFGDDSVAPLLALMTGKQIAFDIVDTNEQVFASGLVNLESTLEKIKKENVLFIARSTQGISTLPDAREFLNNDCQLLSQFHDKMEGDYLVYRC